MSLAAISARINTSSLSGMEAIVPCSQKGEKHMTGEKYIDVEQELELE
jgi:hypothetical protein